MNIVNGLHLLWALIIVVAVIRHSVLNVPEHRISSFQLFYSCYDKIKKRLNFAVKLRQIFSFRSVSYSFNEINKVLALAGLTLLGYSFINITNLSANKIRLNAFYMLAVHGCYSLYTFFDRYFGQKQFAMFLGSLSLTSLAAIQFGYPIALPSAFTICSLITATAHFYTMETKPQGLAVRPFGYLAFVTSLGGMAMFVFGNRKAQFELC